MHYVAAGPKREVTREHECRAWDRRQQGLSQVRIARELGVHQAAVCRMLSGKKSLRIDTNDPAGFKVVEKK